jgi:hypothetical protein
MALDLCTQWGRRDEPISANPSSLELPDTTKELISVHAISSIVVIVLNFKTGILGFGEINHLELLGMKTLCCQGLYLQLDFGGPLESEEGTPSYDVSSSARVPLFQRDRGSGSAIACSTKP